jgi:hypothetical protein
MVAGQEIGIDPLLLDVEVVFIAAGQKKEERSLACRAKKRYAVPHETTC